MRAMKRTGSGSLLAVRPSTSACGVQQLTVEETESGSLLRRDPTQAHVSSSGAEFLLHNGDSTAILRRKTAAYPPF